MSVARPKIKDDVHYKQGLTWAYCSHCNHFVYDYQVTGIGGEAMGTEPRCYIIGLKDGRGYRINPASICDRWDNSEHMKRYRGPLNEVYGSKPFYSPPGWRFRGPPRPPFLFLHFFSKNHHKYL